MVLRDWPAADDSARTAANCIFAFLH